jgi:uncharacterized Zn finger protein (UPF0148 family)
MSIESQPEPSENNTQLQGPVDLVACPRCGEPIEELVWGQTNCPRCGLHFECC